MFGIIFVVFSALAIIISYELTTTVYTSAAPLIFFALTVLTAAVPYIVLAILSFTVAFVSSKISDSTDEALPENQTKLEIDTEKIQS